MSDLPIKIRGLSEPNRPMLDSGGVIINQEKAFIASSWAHKERNNPVYFWVSKRAFHYQFYLGVVCLLLDERPELFQVACNEDKPDQILGWACQEPQGTPALRSVVSHAPIYQVYVKEDFREYDIFELLTGLREWCNPREFMELINDTRKNQAAGSHIPESDARTRQAVSAAPGSTVGA